MLIDAIQSMIMEPYFRNVFKADSVIRGRISATDITDELMVLASAVNTLSYPQLESQARRLRIIAGQRI